MLIAYINLDSRPDRRAAMEQQFARLGLAAERLSALSPAQLRPELVAAHCSATAGTWVSPAELACALSHRLAWDLMAARGTSTMLVLEDDITLTSQLVDWLPRAALAMSRLDVLRLETRGQPLLLGPRFAERHGVDLHRFYSYPYGASAYVITRRAADRLRSSRYLDYALDDLLFDPHAPKPALLRTAQAVPALVMGTTVDEIGPHAFAFGSDLYADRQKRLLQAEGRAPVRQRPVQQAWQRGIRLLGRVQRAWPGHVDPTWTLVPLAGQTHASQVA